MSNFRSSLVRYLNDEENIEPYAGKDNMAEGKKFRERIIHQFDSYSKRAILYAAFNAVRQISRDRTYRNSISLEDETLTDMSFTDIYRAEQHHLVTDFIEHYLENERLFHALKELPKQQMETIVLSMLDEMSVEEVADTLNKSKDSIYKNKERGFRKLKELMHGEE